MKAALIIVAGERKTDFFEPMEKIGNVSAIQRLIIIFQQAGIERIVLITGHNAEKLERHVARMGVVCLRNKEYENTQMLDSIKIGLNYFKGKCETVIISPVNTPLFTPETVCALCAVKEPVAMPTYAGKKGNPIMLNKSMFAFVGKYSGSEGLAGAIKNSGKPVNLLKLEDEGVLADVTKKQDYNELLQKQVKRKAHPEAKIYISRESIFYGPGIHQLLGYVQETGSLRLACQQMGLSYSKAWKMVCEIDKKLGAPVLERQHGGKNGGGSFLTPKGKEIVEKYDMFMAECKVQIQQNFDKYFCEL